MEEIFNKLRELSNESSQIILYQVNLKDIMKGIGRVIGKFDSELLDFLKHTNGASIFDYCFMGFKNPKLGVDIDKFSREIWVSNNRLVGKFIPFMSTSSGDNFGYISDVVSSKNTHLIFYYSESMENNLYLMGSSFNKFMFTFLYDVEATLKRNQGRLILGIDIVDWPIKTDHWTKSDSELESIRKNGSIHEQFKKIMPDMVVY